MGIHTVEDLLLYLPRAHEDLTAMGSIATAAFGEKVTIRGAVTNLKLVYTRTRKRLVTAVFTDGEGGSADVVWFNQPHVMRMLAEGQEVVLTGKLAEDGRRLIFQSPQFELGGRRELLHAGRLVPIYPQHDIISTKWLREKMVLVRDAIDAIPETLPPSVLEEEKLLPRSHMVKALHFPDDPSHVQAALDRMAFEEMFAVQRTALERRQAWQGATQDRLKIPMDVELIKAFFASLKFTPTGSQKIAIYEILRDLERPIPMSRLLEGDVGSGKTLVAVAVMATVVKAGGQCALMVPTEVLSRQHAETITRLLLNFHSYLHTNPSVLLPLPRVALLTGSTPPADARDIRDKLCGGMIDIVIGTHALIEESVQFKDLRLVIVDEQHRFGVLQRQRLTEKGSPHFLSMTATPIPRTLALTAYGDHDLSVLLEKPGNRKPIRTKVVAPKDRKTVELFIDREIEDGRQAFVICPLITGSESEEIRDVKSVEEESKRLSEAFPRRRVSMLHGRMSGKEKDDIMRRFKDRQSDILVSTSVIEVGIDVPNSTIIVIEGAERFGLAQLHQFRGRVGRGEHQSHCFLFATTPEQARSPRLKAMEEYDSGFQLAEIDLKLR
jgi:ATP-dependent DNA helicase RecG